MAYEERSPQQRRIKMTPAERRAAANEMEGSRSAQKALGRKMVKKVREGRKYER